jgi:uncharacterized membrane protein (UPF0127 family)
MIINLTQKKYIARSPFYAQGYIVRLRGMLGRSFATTNFDAMVFSNCNCIHTMFMQSHIDVIFVRRDNVVSKICVALPPWKLWAREADAFTILELPVGVITNTNTHIGDVLDLSAELFSDSALEVTVSDVMPIVETIVQYKANK